LLLLKIDNILIGCLYGRGGLYFDVLGVLDCFVVFDCWVLFDCGVIIVDV